jgi:hypothetical protein
LNVHSRGDRANACGRSFTVLSAQVSKLHGVVGAGFNTWFGLAARSAKTDACGRSFAVVSTQVSAVGLRLG